MLDQAPVAIGLFRGEEQVVLSANEQLCSVWGKRPEQVLRKPLLHGVPELRGQGFAELMAEVAKTLVPFHGNELPAQLHKNGKLETSYFNFVFQPLHDPLGNLLGVLSIAIDVTAQVLSRKEVQALNNELETRVAARTREVQLAQAKAELHRQRLERLFMQAPAAICILNGPDLVFELVNPAYQELFSNRVLLGKPILEALPEIADNKVYSTFRHVYETGNTHLEENLLVPLVRKEDGVLEDRYFKFIQQARFNEQGEVDGVLAFAFEVTTQVEALQASETSAKNLRLITDALPVLIGYLDKEEKYRFANQAYEAWFNQRPEELLGRAVRDVVGEAAYNGVKVYIDRALAGERLDFESRMPYREDFVKYIRTSYVPDYRNGEVAGFYTLVNDITEQVKAQKSVESSEKQAKELAAELAVANKELRRANEDIKAANQELSSTNQQLTRINSDLDNFIYTASHDLKAPILNIEGLMKALLDELPAVSLQSSLSNRIIDMILESVQRFKRTINHLTEISKLQKENDKKTSVVDLAATIADVQLDLAPVIEAAGAQIEVDVAQCSTINFSEKNLRSIIYNLLSNAIKYSSPDRVPEIRVTCDATEDYQVLTVQDNGLGMDMVQNQKLFGMFQRLHSHVDGSGIGLFMVKRMIDNAGGKIEVQSQENEGATFKVYFRRDS
ncbi:PAS domain-containing sensor histidine kinase [Pontibacter rugosus]